MPAADVNTPALNAIAQSLQSPSGLQVQLFAHGALQRMDCHGVMLNLFVGNALEGGPTNLWLRDLGEDAAQAMRRSAITEARSTFRAGRIWATASSSIG